MTSYERHVLEHVTQGDIMFHNGRWGAPMGYVWADRDGGAAGQVPQPQSQALDRLERRRLVVIRPRVGARYATVEATDEGWRRLTEVIDRSSAA